MTDLGGYFQRCYAVNLDRRPDRYELFTKQVPADWPFAAIERFAAIDGKRVPHPAWWRCGGGAWGCFQSHLQLIERCLNEGVSSVLLLEDDALFCPDFTAKAAEFLAHVPDDWGMIYLGGQHLFVKQRKPGKINDWVYRPYNVNRTHAFALRGEGMRTVYNWLRGLKWKPGHHIDHHLGRLTMSQTIPVYCPKKWLVGQAAGKSNVSGREPPERIWNGAAELSAASQEKALPPVIAVVGSFRSGTSCIAGLLSALGVPFGNCPRPANANNPKGFFEDWRLSRFCRWSFREPVMAERNTVAIRTGKLRAWAKTRARGNEQPFLGAKHPTLSLMVPEMLAAWPGVKIVCADRLMGDSSDSLLRAGWKAWRPEVAATTIAKMVTVRDAALQNASAPVLRIDFAQLTTDPEKTISALVEFCGLSPTAEQLAAASAFVIRRPTQQKPESRESRVESPPLLSTLDSRPSTPSAGQPHVWTYWEGPMPPWIGLCLETFRRNVPGVEILTRETWEDLYDGAMVPREILNRQRLNVKSDFIRAWLLHRIGGIWVDADAIMFRDPHPIFTELDRGDADFVAYKMGPRQGEFCTALIAGRPESAIGKAYLDAMVARLLSGGRLAWPALGPARLREACGRFPDAVLGVVPNRLVMPIWWRQRHRLRGPADTFDLDDDAICVMLGHRMLGPMRHWSQRRILQSDTVAGSAFRRALSISKGVVAA